MKVHCTDYWETVNQHFMGLLQVKSVLDPCEDENNDNQDDDASLGADSLQRDGGSESDSDVKYLHSFLFIFF